MAIPHLEGSVVWYGPYTNPLEGVRVLAGDNELTDRMQQCILEITHWYELDEKHFLQDLLQEIAGATNIVAQERDDGWYVSLDN